MRPGGTHDLVARALISTRTREAIFTHIRDVRGLLEELKPGQRVSFDEGTDARNGKACAKNVTPL